MYLLKKGEGVEDWGLQGVKEDSKASYKCDFCKEKRDAAAAVGSSSGNGNNNGGGNSSAGGDKTSSD